MSPPQQSSPWPIILAIVGGVALVVLLIAGTLFALLRPAVGAAQEAARRNSCLNQSRMVGIALANYEAGHARFPPAYVADENGKPMHSWRVLILRELGYPHLYNQYNFDEPWDSPNNLEVARKMPAEYGCPSDPNAEGSQDTHWMVIVGPETLFPGTETRRMRDIRDGGSGTLLVVEVADSGVIWTQPVDLDYSQMDWQVNGTPGNSISSHHSGDIAMVVYVDGHATPVTSSTSPQTLRDLTTIAGGEPVVLP